MHCFNLFKHIGSKSMEKGKSISSLSSSDSAPNDLAKASEISVPALDEQDRDNDIIDEVDDVIENRPGILYPEILFYLISVYIKPEQVGTFARINKAAYAWTQRESFWRNLYKRYCQDHPDLPHTLKIENFKVYGLRQRVVRALHHTYPIFVHKSLQTKQDPHHLVKSRCINVWYHTTALDWLVYFKFKKMPLVRPQDDNENMLEEIGNIYANPEEDCQILQLTCTSFHEFPLLKGMILTFVMVLMTPDFYHKHLRLGFSTTHASPTRPAEQTVDIDTVLGILVLDWWHPKYPYFESRRLT